jgi:hypothetical protein
MSCETTSPPYIQLPSTYKDCTWDGLTWTVTASDGTEFADTLSSATFVLKDEDGTAVLTLTSATAGQITLNVTTADAWSLTVEPRILTLSAATYSWTLTTTDSASVVKPRLVGTLQIKEP